MALIMALLSMLALLAAPTLGQSGYAQGQYQTSLLSSSLTTALAATHGVAQTSSSSNPAGLSVGLMTVGACAVFAQIHSHPFADELCTVLSGQFTLGMMIDASSTFSPAQPNNSPVFEKTNQGPGAQMTFPRGQLHWQVNEGCTTGQMMFSWNAANPGLALFPTMADGLPSYLANIEFNTTSLPPNTGVFARDPACLKRCGLN